MLTKTDLSLETIINEMLDMTIEEDRYVAPWTQTKWVSLSSLLFIFPCIYGVINKQYFLSAILFMLSVISVIFWVDATYSWRRLLDRIFAKLTFSIFLVSGMMYVTSLFYSILAYTGLFSSMYCYYMSTKYCALNNNELWWKYHVAFHIIVTIIQFIIMKSAIEYDKRRIKRK